MINISFSHNFCHINCHIASIIYFILRINKILSFGIIKLKTDYFFNFFFTTIRHCYSKHLLITHLIPPIITSISLAQKMCNFNNFIVFFLVKTTYNHKNSKTLSNYPDILYHLFL